jgi:arsenite methyltransferase
MCAQARSRRLPSSGRPPSSQAARTSWTQRFADPHLPRSLASQLRAAGFKVNQPQVLVLLNPDYSPDTYSIANGEIMADFAVTRGQLTRKEANAWLADLHQLGRQGRYFFSLNRYLFLATR